MIFDAADSECWRVLVLADAGEVGVDAVAECWVAKEGSATFRREHDVHVDLYERLRHCVENPKGVGHCSPG